MGGSKRVIFGPFLGFFWGFRRDPRRLPMVLQPVKSRGVRRGHFWTILGGGFGPNPTLLTTVPPKRVQKIDFWGHFGSKNTTNLKKTRFPILVLFWFFKKCVFRFDTFWTVMKSVKKCQNVSQMSFCKKSAKVQNRCAQSVFRTRFWTILTKTEVASFGLKVPFFGPFLRSKKRGRRNNTKNGVD